MGNFAIIIYSTYGHVAAMAESVKAGIESAGSKATILQVPETLSEEVLQKMYAPAKPDYPIVSADDLTKYDGVVFGFPSRFGSVPAQITAFTDTSGGLWASGALYHKPGAFFVSSASPGTQEVTAKSILSFFVHHGIIYVPLGYGKAFGQLANIEEPHGGSAWGAGAFAGGDGSRAVSDLEKEIAKIQGAEFATVASKLTAATAPAAAEKAPAAAPAAAPAEATKKTAEAATPAKTEKSESGCCTIV